jgi:hypothetical protein
LGLSRFTTAEEVGMAGARIAASVMRVRYRQQEAAAL